MLGIGRPDRHALPHITSSKNKRTATRAPSRASGFVQPPQADPRSGNQVLDLIDLRCVDNGVFHSELLRKEDYLKSGDSGAGF
jgi:hypothetical protein